MRAEHLLLAASEVNSGGGKRPPLIAHIVYSFDVGGLENGLVNLINSIPVERYRHVIICLTKFSDFRLRLQRQDVAVFALDNPAGNSPLTLFRLWLLLRRLRPDIVHTRNLAALEGSVPAYFAGVPVRIHGEHGRDINDLEGNNRKYQLWRRVLKVFVDHFIAVSKDLQNYLQQRIHVKPECVTQIYNGVDSRKFKSAGDFHCALPVPGFSESGEFVIGTVGRMQSVKDQVTLAHAFVLLMGKVPRAPSRLRLVMIGDGPLRERALDVLKAAGIEQYAWLPGERNDIADLMRGFDLFVLPSLAEGISNTILEAMATGLPVVGTAVGGNSELIQSEITGTLVPSADAKRMAEAIELYVNDPGLCHHQGTAARCVVESQFSLDSMLSAYLKVYDRLFAMKKSMLRPEMKAETK